MKQKHPVVKQGSPRHNRLGLAVGEFTSWDILTGPGRLLNYLGHALVSPQPLTIMLLTFAGIATIYWLLKHISLAISLSWRTQYWPTQYWPTQYWPTKRREWNAIAQPLKKTA